MNLMKWWEDHNEAVFGCVLLVVGIALFIKWSAVPNTYTHETLHTLHTGEFYITDLFKYALRDSVADIGRMFAGILCFTAGMEFMAYAEKRGEVGPLPHRLLRIGYSIIVAVVSFILFAVVM